MCGMVVDVFSFVGESSDEKYRERGGSWQEGDAS